MKKGFVIVENILKSIDKSNKICLSVKTKLVLKLQAKDLTPTALCSL